MKKNKTLKDVAMAAGVSKMTASRALRGDKDVSKANIEKVRRAAQNIGYVGNHLAASLSNRRSDLVGVVVPSLSNIVYPQVISGVTDALAVTSLQPVIGVTDYDFDKETEVIANMLSWRPAGLIVTGLEQSQSTRTLLEDAKLPIVQIMDTDGTPIGSTVGFSQTEAGHDMATALLALGRKNLGYIGCNLDKDSRASKRRRGYLKAMNAKGIMFQGEVLADGLSSVASGRTLTKDLLSQCSDLDCIFYSNDDLAVGGLSYCTEIGLDVPKTIAIAGFNGLDLLEAFPGKVATSKTSRHEIGMEAAKLVISALRKEDQEPPVQRIIRPKICLGSLGSMKAKKN